MDFVDLIIAFLVVSFLYSFISDLNQNMKRTRNANSHANEMLRTYTSPKALQQPKREEIQQQLNAETNVCAYCGNSTTPASAYTLTNCMVLHKKCYYYCLENKSYGVLEREIIEKAHAYWNAHPPILQTYAVSQPVPQPQRPVTQPQRPVTQPQRPVPQLETNNNVCMYCGNSTTPATAHILTNGMVLHKECYNYCLENKSNGFREKDVIGKAHAFWNGYPPDWQHGRKAGVLREAGYKCEICGKSGVELSIHHIVPLSQGGSNAFENLQALCETCHSNAHAGRDMRRNFDRSDNSIKHLVYEAVSANRDIRIVYVDYHNQRTERCVKPKRVISRNTYLVLEAYCYLRHNEREFVLSRIKDASYV